MSLLFLCPPKRLGGAATGAVPTGGGGAKGFRKVAGGDVVVGQFYLEVPEM